MNEATAHPWAADLAEARERTKAHVARRSVPVIEMPRPSALIQDPLFLEEDAHAETQPTGGALGWILAVLGGLAITAAIVWGPRVLRFLWAVAR